MNPNAPKPRAKFIIRPGSQSPIRPAGSDPRPEPSRARRTGRPPVRTEAPDNPVIAGEPFSWAKRARVSVAHGLEAAAKAELDQLGIKILDSHRGGFEVAVTREGIYRLCLEARIPSRVVIEIKSFAAHHAEMLYAQVRRVPWEKFISPKDTFKIVASISDTPTFTHANFFGLKVKDGICDRMRRECGERPNVDPESPDYVIVASVRAGRASLGLDVTGDPLHRRGYRAGPATAPLKESLAAGILTLSGLAIDATADSTLPILDPFCGTGTLLIEAAMVRARRAPGLARPQFGFERWQGYDGKLMKRLRDEALARANEAPRAPNRPLLLGTDADPEAIRAARYNAKRAGVAEWIQFDVRDIRQGLLIPTGASSGAIVTNPPYGERVIDTTEDQSANGEIVELYRTLGTVSRKASGWKLWILSGNPEVTRHMGLKADEKFALRNGAIDCRLLGYTLRERTQPPAIS